MSYQELDLGHLGLLMPPTFCWQYEAFELMKKYNTYWKPKEEK